MRQTSAIAQPFGRRDWVENAAVKVYNGLALLRAGRSARESSCGSSAPSLQGHARRPRHRGKYGYPSFATRGQLARRVIGERRARAAFAVACEGIWSVDCTMWLESAGAGAHDDPAVRPLQGCATRSRRLEEAQVVRRVAPRLTPVPAAAASLLQAESAVSPLLPPCCVGRSPVDLHIASACPATPRGLSSPLDGPRDLALQLSLGKKRVGHRAVDRFDGDQREARWPGSAHARTLRTVCDGPAFGGSSSGRIEPAALDEAVAKLDPCGGDRIVPHHLRQPPGRFGGREPNLDRLGFGQCRENRPRGRGLASEQSRHRYRHCPQDSHDQSLCGGVPGGCGPAVWHRVVAVESAGSSAPPLHRRGDDNPPPAHAFRSAGPASDPAV